MSLHNVDSSNGYIEALDRDGYAVSKPIVQDNGQNISTASSTTDILISDTEIIDDDVLVIKLNDGSYNNFIAEDVNRLNPNNIDPFNDNSLIAKYLLNNNADDLLGNRNGTWEGTEQYTTGMFNSGAKFDDVSGIKIGDYDLSGVKAISLWFNMSGEHSDVWRTIIGSKVINQPQNNQKLVISGDDNLLCTYHDHSIQDVGFGAVESNTWHHVVINENSNGNYDYFVNGINTANDLPDNNASLDLYYIGSDNNDGEINEAFDGIIDHVELYDRILTQAEVDKLYTQNKYILSTSSITNGEVPDVVYKEENMESDFTSIRNILAKYEYVNISDGSISNTLKTVEKIIDGDKLVLVLDDDSIHEIVASGITGTGPYEMDTTAITGGEVPSRAYRVDEGISINNTGSGVNSNTYTGTDPLLCERTFDDIDVSGRTLETKVQMSATGNKMTELTFDVWREG